MRIKRLTGVSSGITFVLLAALGLVGFSGIAAADPPFADVFVEVFDDVNPCTGDIHTVTITITAWVHDHQDRVVARGERTITTNTGFEGRGTDSFVVNGNIAKFGLNDILSNPSGDRLRAHFVIVIDISTDTVLAIEGSVTCLGP